MKSEKKFLNKKENEEIQYEQIKQRIKDSNLYEVSKADTYGVPVFNMDLIEIKEDIRKMSYSKYLIPDLFLKNVVNPFLKKYIFVNTLLDEKFAPEILTIKPYSNMIKIRINNKSEMELWTNNLSEMDIRKTVLDSFLQANKDLFAQKGEIFFQVTFKDTEYRSAQNLTITVSSNLSKIITPKSEAYTLKEFEKDGEKTYLQIIDTNSSRYAANDLLFGNVFSISESIARLRFKRQRECTQFVPFEKIVTKAIEENLDIKAIKIENVNKEANIEKTAEAIADKKDESKNIFKEYTNKLSLISKTIESNENIKNNEFIVPLKKLEANIENISSIYANSLELTDKTGKKIEKAFNTYLPLIKNSIEKYSKVSELTLNTSYSDEIKGQLEEVPKNITNIINGLNKELEDICGLEMLSSALDLNAETTAFSGKYANSLTLDNILKNKEEETEKEKILNSLKSLSKEERDEILNSFNDDNML